VLPPRKLYKIGEVMEFSGLSRQTVHNYTQWGLISEAERTPKGHRLYGEDVFDRLRRIAELKKTRTLKEIRRILKGRSTKRGGADEPVEPPDMRAPRQ
jgi:DNA-binding transcriptional MerR regulator